MDLDPIEVQRHLGGASYPATGDELARLAEDDGAPDDIVEALRGIGADEVSGPDDAMRRLG